MKLLRSYCFLLLAVATFAASAASGPCLTFNDTICDLGRITVDSGYHECLFEFTNKSDSAVTIIGALSACSCTIPSYPKEPVHPGEKGVVRVTYDSAGRPPGVFDKTIILITTGEPRRITLHITGEAFTLFNSF